MPDILKHQPEAQEHTESIDERILHTIREGLYRVLDTIHPSLTLRVNQLLIRLKMWELRVLGKHANTLAYHEPNRLILATNNTCNFKCVWCPQSLDNFKSSYTITDMRLEDIETILQRRKRPLSHIDIQGIGEPLLHRDIIRVINLAGKHARNVEMVTNGSLLDEHRRAQLKQSALTKLCVSIDGTDEEIFKRIRKR